MMMILMIMMTMKIITMIIVIIIIIKKKIKQCKYDSYNNVDKDINSNGNMT